MSKVKTVTAQEAAALLSLSPRYARRVMESAGIPATKEGLTNTYPASAVQKLAKTRKTATKPSTNKEKHGA